jgi:ABC-type multidrug transport system ATPase subunit
LAGLAADGPEDIDLDLRVDPAAVRLPPVEDLAVLDGVGVSLGGRPVLRNLDLTLRVGETVGVAGPNGSGKTTLVRMMATLVRIDAGRGAVLGADLASNAVYGVRRSIGMIGHQPALIGELSLTENLVHMARLASLDESRVGHILELVGLGGAADRRAAASSFGMKRRVEVAHLLLSRPKLLLLDEATSGLDRAAQELITALVDRTPTDGGATVVVSHDEAQLSGLCGRVLRLDSGSLEEVR